MKQRFASFVIVRDERTGEYFYGEAQAAAGVVRLQCPNSFALRSFSGKTNKKFRLMSHFLWPSNQGRATWNF